MNNVIMNKGNKNPKKNPRIQLGGSQMLKNKKRSTNKTKSKILNYNNKKVTNRKTRQKNLNNKVIISYNDFELNSLDYKNALLYDKRTCCDYYLSLLKRKITLIFSFFPINDYNSMIIKSCMFSFSFPIYYAINFAFFTDAIIHEIYENGGKYDVMYFLPKISISFVISYYITAIIKFIFLSERNLYEIRKQSSLNISYTISDKEKKNLTIKYTIFFILGIAFLGFFWMLLSSFGAVYPNTQMFIFKNALISFAISLFYPFLINIFPAIFRMCSLNSKEKNNECIYKLSKFLQVL